MSRFRRLRLGLQLSALMGLLLGVAVEPSIADTTPARLAQDLDAIPTDAAAFVHVRFGDQWHGPGGDAIRGALRADVAVVEQRLGGIRVADVDTITAVWPTLVTTDRRNPPGPVVMVSLRQPLNQAELRRAQEKGGGLRVTRLDDRGVVLFDFASASAQRSYTVQLMRRAAGGPLSAAKDQVRAGHTAVAGLNPRGLAALLAQRQPPAEDEFLTGLARLQPRTVTLDLDFRGTTRVEGVVRFADASAAQAAVGAAERARAWLLERLAALQPTDPAEATVVQTTRDAIKAAVLRQEASDVKVTLGVGGKDLFPAVVGLWTSRLREATARTKSSHNLIQIVLALHNYNDAYQGKLPAHAIYSKDGKPLLSWRVAILPYVEEDNLYRQFKFDEPWDREHNKKLIAQMPKVYLDPTAPPAKEPGRTHYQVLVGGKAPWERGPSAPGMPRSFPDGTSNTILVAEAAEPVIWTKPDDLTYDPNGPLPKLGHTPGRPFMVAVADGSVRAILRTTSEKTLRAAITASGGEPPGPEWQPPR